MLILTRKRNESIKIGGDILIKVVQTKSGLVKLGIEAPANVRVLRGELCEFAAEPVNEAADHPMESKMIPSEVYYEFGVDYAAEVEDQLLCVATD